MATRFEIRIERDSESIGKDFDPCAERASCHLFPKRKSCFTVGAVYAMHSVLPLASQ